MSDNSESSLNGMVITTITFWGIYGAGHLSAKERRDESGQKKKAKRGIKFQVRFRADIQRSGTIELTHDVR